MKKMTMCVLVCLIALTGVSFAKGMGLGETENILPRGKWWKSPRAVEFLKLTSEEQKKLDVLDIQSRRNMIDLKSDAEKQKLELELIFDTENFNENNALNRFQKFQEARNKMVLERYRFLVEVRKILGQERFQQLKEKFRQLRKDRFRKKRIQRRPGMQGQQPMDQQAPPPEPNGE